eukprot:CAMPEP_0172447448 /NCGR_PEP_ID=MMETSP1065-20121228/6761_1 /TAXON_ID=265537 /ORGANISM="Amphiprora paludosa, Strain CCMP125" /LENGTH=478 /DNA_ID=CAMNT_0013198755 /DNA_START=91 /DNA_END=1527 /DNA_ORIENTATION=-
MIGASASTGHPRPVRRKTVILALILAPGLLFTAASVWRSESLKIEATPSTSKDWDHEYLKLFGELSEKPDIGVLSNRSFDFFENIRKAIDNVEPNVRCSRYGFQSNNNSPEGHQKRKRKIYYGALIASEPWELFHIVGTETFGIFEGMVFVEANRTQNLTPRPFLRAFNNQATLIIQQLFGVPKVAVIPYINEDVNVRGLKREHDQRDEIIRGWKEMGMQPDDIGFLCDADEVFTRDFLLALQVCHIPSLEYNEERKCSPILGNKVGVRASAAVFESSPECITQSRVWFHPSAVMGHCIQGIGNDTNNNHEVRAANGIERKVGFGGDGKWEKAIATAHFPLWNGYDFRRMSPSFTPQVSLAAISRRFNPYTAFHFHNFFSTFEKLRFKYATYGHANNLAYNKTLVRLHNDLHLMNLCAKGEPDKDVESLTFRRRPGGFDAFHNPRPIYFEDPNYRKARHALIRSLVLRDEQNFVDKRH